MKQLKFLMVAFTLLMGVSFTSCLNGDTDPTVTNSMPLKLISTYPSYTFQFPNNGLKVVAINNTGLMNSNLKVGDIAYITYSFNSEEQPVTGTTKEISAQVQLLFPNGNSNCSTGTYSLVAADSEVGNNYENATIIDLGSSSSGYPMLYYDKNTLIMFIAYYAKSPENFVSLHKFTLVYDESKNEGQDDVMNLYLRHYNSEPEADLRASSFKAFDLSEFLLRFGKTPTKIRIYISETGKDGSWKLDDVKKEPQYEEIDYKSVFEGNN